MSAANDSFDVGDTWVVKIGSSLLTENGRGLAVDRVVNWVDDIVALRAAGISVVLVSSGAVAEGARRLGLKSRPESIHLLQAAAAVGQMGLIKLYESNFQRHQIHTAQVLLTHDDLRSRERYLNARVCLKSLLDLGVIPVINENDTVVTDEIRFGDNDTLAALVANLIEANTLILLTDQQGLFSKDPSLGDAELIESAAASDTGLLDMAGPGGGMGRGGMVTKVQAAQTASRSGANTIIASGDQAHVLRDIGQGKHIGTRLFADQPMLASRKQWMATLPTRGELILDAGAVRVLTNEGKSLLPVGVRRITGSFTRGEMVACVDESGKEVARGFVNYGDQETTAIIGKPSQQIEAQLGFVNEEELIHRDNLVVL